MRLKVTQLESITEIEFSKEMQSLKAMSGIGGQLSKLIETKPHLKDQNLSIDKKNKRGQQLFSPTKPESEVKKNMIKSMQNSILTPKNRVKTKSLYDSTTQKKHEIPQSTFKEEAKSKFTKEGAIRQATKSSSSFDELEDNVDEFF